MSKTSSFAETMKNTKETSFNRKKPLSNHCAIIGKSGSGSTFQSSSYVARSAADSRRRYGRDPPAATNWSFQWKSYDDLMIIAIRVGGSNFATTQTRGHFYVRFYVYVVTWWLEALTTSSIIESDPRAFDFIVVGYLSLCVSRLSSTAFGNWVPDKWQLCNSSIDGKLAV